MNIPYKILSLLTILTFQLTGAQDQQVVKIHSHNDYNQSVPFWDAYGNGLQSMEIDVFLKNDILYVTHDEEDIVQNRTVDNLYLQPLEKAVTLQLGTQPREVQLLFDLKSEAKPTLEKLIAVLEKHPLLISNKSLSFVITGNRPNADLYTSYPDYIFFDHQNLEKISDPKSWDKVALISLPFQRFSGWNGKGRLTHEDLAKVTEVIAKAHELGKPFRFWGCPDTKTAWSTFLSLGVDYINTDKPYEAAKYINSLPLRIYAGDIHSQVYTPTYLSDRQDRAVENIILLIGDGNGLSQISAATLANGGQLSLTTLKSIGLLKTSAADDFTTDSAAAATALATGEKTNNRAIGVASDGRTLKNLTEILAENGYSIGIVTTDQITGATPAAFYAHQKDRDMENGIKKDLLQSKLSLFAGGGNPGTSDAFLASGFALLDEVSQLGSSRKDKVGLILGKKNVPGVLGGRGNLLAETTQNALAFLRAKSKPFFLMVESSQIDSNGHYNHTGGIVAEGIDFDRAITAALKFADASGNTLVVVAADHETSGFSLPHGLPNGETIEGDFTTDDHTASMVPLFAYGPKSDHFSGVYENTEVFQKLLHVLGIKN